MTPEIQGCAFVVMPFGRKPGPDGVPIDFDRVYADYLAPAIVAAGLRPHRADLERRGGSIHDDMFQDLLLAEFVVADLTVDNPNVWYEIGVRHALRSSGAVLTYALRDRLPFDLNGQRMIRYTLIDGIPDAASLDAERATLTEAIRATLAAWRGRRASPVYASLPNLREPDWKSLRVGNVTESWQALERWQGRIEVARRRQLPGDICILAEEPPNSALAFEALRTAGKALLDLNRPGYALVTLQRARARDPDDVPARQFEAIALGRLGRLEEAAELLRVLIEERRAAGQPAGEALALLARTRKDHWRHLWESRRQDGVDPLAAARATAPALAAAAEAYAQAARAAPGDFYPAINALALGRLWEHATSRTSRLALATLASGLRWTIDCAIAAARDYWSLVTRAEFALIENEADAALEAFEEAAALAVEQGYGFAIDSSRQQLALYQALDFRGAIVADALAVLDAAETQLGAVQVRSLRTARHEPARVVLFSGHMVDRPDRATPRFPEAWADAAGLRIGAELDAIGAAAGDLGIAQAASGGDLLFAEACLARGMRMLVMLPRHEIEFLQGSVAFAHPRWQLAYDRLKADQAAEFRWMPDELGPDPAGVDPYDRCNRWMLHTALSFGLARAAFVALWNGEPGDGPGGTETMIANHRRMTGREPRIVRPAPP